MRVICVDAKGRPGDHPTGVLKEGGCYKVVDEKMARGTDGRRAMCYVLEEFGPLMGFEKDRFVPLSSIDETQFERNYNKELV